MFDEGILYRNIYTKIYELDGYEIKGEYPINFCPNCGKKFEKFDEKN
jgi:rubrerythrin